MREGLKGRGNKDELACLFVVGAELSLGLRQFFLKAVLGDGCDGSVLLVDGLWRIGR